MKKIISLLLTASMLALASCGDKTSENDPSKDSSGSVSVGDNSEQENSTPESDEKPDEVSFYDFNGLNIREPDNLELLEFSNSKIWGREYEAEEKLYFAIVYNGLNYSDSYDPSTYGLDDVWEILNHELGVNINQVYFHIAEFYDAEVDTTENVDILSAEFRRSTGIVPYRTFDKEHIDIHYTAYYGILDFPAHGNYPEFKSVPIMWIAFSDVESDEMQAQMDKIVDDVAKNASWLSDES